MKPLKLALLIAASLGTSISVHADEISDLKAEFLQMRADYEQRIEQLEQRLAQAEVTTNEVKTEVASVKATPSPTATTRNNNSFNPAISMVLNGQFSNYSESPDNYELSGFALQGEGGLAPEGLSLGESEITMSASIDQLLFGQATIALHDDAGTTEVGIEEAFIQTLGLSNGITVRAGRFYSPMGYLNEKHIHAWNFADAPLIYRGLFGNQLTTDGVKFSYLLPTDQMIELGGTVGSGDQHPGAGTNSGIGDWLIYARTGGDIGTNHSWQASASHWQSSPKDREYAGGHNHGGDAGADPVLFNGDTDISNVSLIYKWAPNGNFKQKNITLLGEYFYLNEDGQLNNSTELAQYDAKQYGGFVEGIYQFAPRWRTGARYDWLGSKLRASDDELLTDADLDFSGFHPQRYSLMLEWLPSEFSRVRAQVNHDKSSRNDDTQLFLQYTVSIGAHGAHSF
ncbi:MAG: carbohydrate porin [Gammaproteobacteria bacterium]|nr:carbohydrate porin [Gammaproteobacteria bacterium]